MRWVSCSLEGSLVGSQYPPPPNVALYLQRLTGKTPDNLEELREMALDVDLEEEEDEDCEADSQSEDEEFDHTQSDSEEEASDQEEAADD